MWRSINLKLASKPINGFKLVSTVSSLRQLSHVSANRDPNATQDYDIVINGGGIVGFALLAALKCSPYLRQTRITLLEKQLEPQSRPQTIKSNDCPFGNRVSAITNATKALFERIGIWDELKSFAKPVKLMHVWSRSFENAVVFNGHKSDHNFWPDFGLVESDVNSADVCYIVENDRIIDALRVRLESDHSVCYGTVVTDVQSDRHLLNVSTKCTKNDYINSISTPLLIGSDGVNSIVRLKSNLKYFEEDLQQIGIVGTIGVQPSINDCENEIAFQRFVVCDNLVIAVLPLSADHSSIVISASNEIVNQLMQLDDNQFVDVLNEYIQSDDSQSTNFLDTIDGFIKSFIPSRFTVSEPPHYSAPYVRSLVANSRAIFPLKFGTTLPFLVGSVPNSNNNNIVVIGDAAHRVHPLAGQGLNLGLGDAQTLAQCLHNALSRGENLFGHNADSCQLNKCLYEFERQRQIKLIPIMIAIHSMQSLFNLVTPNMINLFNRCDIIKEQMVAFANSK